jgi:resuscitation-promoting factor RpfA
VDLARSLPSPSAGRHRAPRRPGRFGRAALAAVAVGAPVVPTVLVAAPAAHAETDWDALAQCESGGDWTVNTGNGFSGGLQFTPSTWRSFGGSGSPEGASREEQIQVAERVKAAQGMNAWPTCSRSTGQTDDSPNSGSSAASSGSASSDEDSSSGNSSSRDSGSSSDESSSASADSGTSSDYSGASSDDSGSSSATSGSSSDDTPAPVRQASAAPAPAGSYTVRAGDTLSSIAASQGTSWRALAQGNPDVLSDPNLIFPGQTITMA